MLIQLNKNILEDLLNYLKQNKFISSYVIYDNENNLNIVKLMSEYDDYEIKKEIYKYRDTYANDNFKVSIYILDRTIIKLKEKEIN